MRVTQKDLDQAIETLNKVSTVEFKPYNCYGYSQLNEAKTGSNIYSTMGCSKKELYYQIQFYLRIKELEDLEK